jgi:hypothetical protein
MLTAGAAAYALPGTGRPQAGQLTDSAQPVGLSSAAHVGIGTAAGAGAAASAMIHIAKTASGSVARASATPQGSTSPQAAAKSPATPDRDRELVVNARRACVEYGDLAQGVLVRDTTNREGERLRSPLTHGRASHGLACAWGRQECHVVAFGAFGK